MSPSFILLLPVMIFLSDAWHLTWLVFAVGGVLFPVVMAICGLLNDREK
ncbi:MAG: hypothetical protein J6M12_03725 [Clostridia bacterium]|nr:hypothetical protein [Clostridia bacterium]